MKDPKALDRDLSFERSGKTLLRKYSLESLYGSMRGLCQDNGAE